MICIDLKVAGIPYVDGSGRVFDFHALRRHFITSLAQSGVHAKDAQALARHSTITLTMDRYTHVSVCDMNDALARLPSHPTTDADADALQATGTEPGLLHVEGASPMLPHTCPNEGLESPKSRKVMKRGYSTTKKTREKLRFYRGLRQ
jgi:hypothetical protein